MDNKTKYKDKKLKTVYLIFIGRKDAEMAQPLRKLQPSLMPLLPSWFLRV
jgi:hypothetical protein